MKKYILIGICLVILITVSVIININRRADSASPTFLQVSRTAAATSTLNYMTPGKATTTLVFDSYIYNGVGEIAGNLVFNTNIQYTGSSSASVLNIGYEYSNDNRCAATPLICDWYKYTTQTGTVATTTMIAGYRDNSLVAASTTIGTATIKSSITPVTIQVPIYMRFIRVVFSSPVGGGNGGLWAETIGVKSRQ